MPCSHIQATFVWLTIIARLDDLAPTDITRVFPAVGVMEIVNDAATALPVVPLAA